MIDDNYPRSGEQVRAALLEIFRHQDETAEVKLLENCSVSIEFTEHDNWDGGTFYYTLHIEVPFKLFAEIESRVGIFELKFKNKVEAIFRNIKNHHITEVIIGPDLEEVASVPHKNIPTDEETSRLWEEMTFRLFLSHTSQHKVLVSKLKKQLRIYGVSTFVAHDDITPSLEWQKEIEIALNTMHALAALLTADFQSSLWCDHEVGYAAGKGIFALPVKVDIDPYGFLGKQQGLPGSLSELSRLASDMVDVLLKQERTHDLMRDSLVNAMESSYEFQMSKLLISKLESISDYSTGHMQSLERAINNNSQVREAFGVPARIKAIMLDHGYSLEEDGLF